MTIHDKEVEKSAENEIHKIKEDLIIEKAGVISYKILLRLAEQTNIQSAIDTLKQNLEEEQSMSDWITENASALIDELWPKIESSLIE